MVNINPRMHPQMTITPFDVVDQLTSPFDDFSKKSPFGYQTLPKLFDVIMGTDTGFPFFNVSKDNTGEYLIEIALAGYGKDDVEIELKDDKIIVTGDSRKKLDSLMLEEELNRTFYVKNIAERKFVRTFSLAKGTRVTNAKMDNGILSITLVKEEPKEDKVKINID
jgi:molecular chaperone IbpA